MIIHVCAIVDFLLCSNNIAYIYSTAGENLAKKMKDNTYQYYAGSMVYDNTKALTSLRRFVA